MGRTCQSEGARKLTADTTQLPLSGRRGAGLRCGLGGMPWRPALCRGAPEPFTSFEYRRVPAGAPIREFVAAAVACGVKYSPLKNFPHDLAIGVAHYGHIVRGGWRRVLKDGQNFPHDLAIGVAHYGHIAVLGAGVRGRSRCLRRQI
jgi:hypothetical protein